MINNQEVFEFSYEILKLDNNSDILKCYEDFTKHYQSFKDFDFIVATNDDRGSSFHTTPISKLNYRIFTDPKDNNKIVVSHPFSKHKNLLYLSSIFKHNIVIDSTLFTDSNAISFFNIKSDFLDFIIENDISINYLPYILEDYINPYRKSNKYTKTLEKVKLFEVVSNLNKEEYLKLGNIQVDMALLKNFGYRSINELLDDKKFFFSHLFNKKDAKQMTTNTGVIFYVSQSNNLFEIDSYFCDYNIIYGLILQIFMLKWDKSDIGTKIYILFDEMNKQGRILKQILYLAYCYFENLNDVNRFLTFSKDWSSHKVIQKAKNIAWDIFLYFKSKDFLSIRTTHNIPIDIALPFFLTKDLKFYESFVRDFDYKVLIYGKSDYPQLQYRPYYGIPLPTKEMIELDEILKSFKSNSYRNRDKYYKIFKNNMKRFSYSILYSKQQEEKILNLF